MAGMGATRRASEGKYIVGAEFDASVSGGVSSGPLVERFPGWPAAAQQTSDRVSLIVWGILAGAIVYALGVHWTLGRVRSIVT